MRQWGEALATEWIGTLEAEVRGAGPGQIVGIVGRQDRDMRPHRSGEEGEGEE